jgi:hypothetical protein
MTEPQKNMWHTPGPWFGLATGTAAPIAALASAGVISIPVALALAAIPAALAVQMLRTLRGADLAQSLAGPAINRYNLRMMAASLAYVAGLLIAVWVFNRFQPEPSIVFAISLLPTVPALAMIFFMFRYIVEETDEYLRHRASLASLIGLGLVLGLGTIWGFMETFGLVPHVWAWWVVPAWAIGLGIGQAILGRRENEENA